MLFLLIDFKADKSNRSHESFIRNFERHARFYFDSPERFRVLRGRPMNLMDRLFDSHETVEENDNKNHSTLSDTDFLEDEPAEEPTEDVEDVEDVDDPSNMDDSNLLVDNDLSFDPCDPVENNTEESDSSQLNSDTNLEQPKSVKSEPMNQLPDKPTEKTDEIDPDCPEDNHQAQPNLQPPANSEDTQRCDEINPDCPEDKQAPKSTPPTNFENIDSELADSTPTSTVLDTSTSADSTPTNHELETSETSESLPTSTEIKTSEPTQSAPISTGMFTLTSTLSTADRTEANTSAPTDLSNAVEDVKDSDSSSSPTGEELAEDEEFQDTKNISQPDEEEEPTGENDETEDDSEEDCG